MTQNSKAMLSKICNLFCKIHMWQCYLLESFFFSSFQHQFISFVDVTMMKISSSCDLHRSRQLDAEGEVRAER